MEKIYSRKIIFDKYYSFSNHLYDLESKFNQSPKPKILVYIDSSGCTNCRIYNLRSWKNYLKDIKPPIDIVYLFQTQDISTLKKTLFLVKLDTTSIYYDIHNNFENKNTFIKKCGFNTFLLDKDNRIILAGSPIQYQIMGIIQKHYIRIRQWEIYNYLRKHYSINFNSI